MYLPYLVLSIGLFFALFLITDRASNHDLSRERTERLQQDCQSRVEARAVLRDVIEQAYTPTQTVGPDTAALIEARRAALLARVPPLRCETQAGIPIPTPLPSPTAGNGGD